MDFANLSFRRWQMVGKTGKRQKKKALGVKYTKSFLVKNPVLMRVYSASCTATAHATVAPTMGLLPLSKAGCLSVTTDALQ